MAYYGLAVSAMALILGVTLARASVPFYCVWVLVAWVAYQMLMELILELLDCCIADNSVYNKLKSFLLFLENDF